MVKRKTSSARVSISALEKISKLSKDSGLTSAEIIDDALSNYWVEPTIEGEEVDRLAQALQAMSNKASSDKGKLDKDDPTVLNVVKVANELGTKDGLAKAIDMFEKTFAPDEEINKFFDKLRKQYRAEFMKSIHDSPSYLRLDNTKPPNAVLDACILSLWGKRGIEEMEFENNPDYESYLMPRHDIMIWVRQQLEIPIDGISWSELNKTWYDTHITSKGKYERTIDNRIKALIRAKIMKYSLGEGYSIYNGKRGYYIIYRDLTDDENIVIEGILKLQPQKGIVIPKII